MIQNPDKSFIQINQNDNVALALKYIPSGATAVVNGIEHLVKEEIGFGHKMALKTIEAGQDIIKYGYPIGHALKRIHAGEWVHTHNCKTNLSGKLEYAYQPVATEGAGNAENTDTFEGYVRDNGNVGIRNEIWIIPTVGCVNRTVMLLQEKAQRLYGHLCDGIYAFPHMAGCSQTGADFETAQKLLAGIIRNPNAGGVLVVSLGCENNDLAHFMPALGNIDEKRIKFLVTQNVSDEIEAGLERIGALAQHVSGDQRQAVSAEKLKIGFKCGGSDAFSGITANPLCGTIADRITRIKGSAVLTEVPEMFGAETILMNRADSEETFYKIVSLINNFKQYYIDYNQSIYENPSPGNKAGGITTLEEKSLGCIQKGGRATVTDTLMYGEPCTKPGLNLLTGPGNDNVSITDILASGAQMLLFTTGRGTPLGTAIPTVKISSNSELFERKANWIDFNAGVVLQGVPLEDLGERLWQFILDVASGKQLAKNETAGYREISIFKNGVLL
jgi:altronate hydrolase